MLKKTIVAIILVLILIQLIPLDRINPEVNKTIALNTDKNVMNILKRACYDCHSNETKWSIYSNIAPLSFEIIAHVNSGRQALNFSNWKKIPTDIKIERLKDSIYTLKKDLMPLPSYVMFHDEAIISKDDQEILVTWFDKELKLISNDKPIKN